MEQINSTFFLVGIIGALLLLVVFLRSQRKVNDKKGEDALCDLFYEQHAFLFSNKKSFFEYEKVKELLFFGKSKFFEEEVTIDKKEKYLSTGKDDLQYVQSILKIN